MSASRWERICAENVTEAREQWSAVADPLKYIHVDPVAVSHHCPYHMRVKRQGGSKLDDWGRVREGRWDKKRRRALRTDILAEDLAVHFLEGLPWEDTALWQRKLDKIRERGKIDGCRTEAELRARYERLDRLFEQIQADGRLRTAEERGASPSDDLFVSIDRAGGYLFGHGGSHRLAIAQLLGLPTIPVRVLMRHAQWQKVREACARGEVPANHPDLTDCQSA
ncbi:hypothetical protein VCB98_10800 [Gammaproteobacteria bacterium AB-CW1]|uniref:ParB/Sulfiredoxin domain-containing protein n=1 Tax=Natronospira elongata TaxID=3110268 RepID=A0AAP6MKU5_9GAMM|nr:hypothetical protein [Gammaproteobacteria bacterium AB-CW1]